MKSESALTSPLMKALDTAMVGSENFKISDRFTFGIPDVAVNWINTVWLEIKATETERLEHHKYWQKQLITCRRLERATHRCWFVVYREMQGVKETIIIRPREVFDDRRLGLAEEVFVGFNHKAVAEFVKEQLSR
jgi:hypothetical protein